MLTQAELKEYLSYDIESGVFTWIKPCNKRMKIGERAGSLNGEGYIQIGINKRSYLAHRLAFIYIGCELDDSEIDHINGIKTDNRIINLRNVSKSKNLQNQRKNHRNNKSSGLLGVSWHKGASKWQAHIRTDNKRIHLGYFTDPKEAHLAYINKKRLLHSTCEI